MPGSTPNLQRILSSAQGLILAKGFPATTIDEICDAAGVTKGGFYYHFESKHQLALALVEHHFDRLVAALAEGAHRTLEDPRSRVLAFVDHAAEVVRGPILRDGCVLGVLALDMAETNPEIRAAISARFSDLAAGLEGDLAAALRNASVAAPVDAGGLARQFLAVLEGSIILAKAHRDPELMVEGLRYYRMSLEAILSATK